MVRRRLLFASFVHAFIVISFIVLYMAGSKSLFTFMMQGKKIIHKLYIG